MKRYDKRMIVLVLVLLTLLTLKSLIVDPARLDDSHMALYGQYALLAAPYQGSGSPPPPWLYTYRTVSVERVGDEGKTVIAFFEPGSEELTEMVLPGRFQAQVRAYLFYVLPVRNIRVEGGLMEDGSDTQG